MDPDSDDQQLVPPFSRGPHARGVWTQEEHDKFLAAVALHPHGPWQSIAALVGSRSVRQVQTHAQKYHEKVNRRARGLQKNRQNVARQEHRVDEAAEDFLARPRGGKGQKRGKYNKRNRDARVAPIPPRPARAVLPASLSLAVAPPSSILETAPTTSSPSVSVSVSASPALKPATPATPAAPAASPLTALLLEGTKIEIDTTLRPPPVVCDTTESAALGGNTDMVEAPLPSPSEVASPDIFKSRSPPRGDLLLEAAELFPLTDDDTSRPATPLVLASPAPSPSPSFPTPVLTAEAIDSMLYDDVVAVEEAPEHALSIGEAPSLNDALDYFLRVMTAWGPTHHGSGSAGGSPISGSALR